MEDATKCYNFQESMKISNHCHKREMDYEIDISYSCDNYDNTQSKAFNDINEVYDINFQTGNEAV